jgi:hypothetical protein
MTWWTNKDKKKRGNQSDEDNFFMNRQRSSQEDDDEELFLNNLEQDEEEEEEEEETDIHGPHQQDDDEDNVRHLPVPSYLTNGYHNNGNKNKNKKENGFNYNYGRSNYGRYDDYDYGYGGYGSYGNYTAWEPKTEKDFDAYDFLKEYSQVFNLFTASTPTISPYSNKAIYIIDVLSKLGVKFRVDIFPAGHTYSYGKTNYATETTSHRLINIIAEPNPNVARACISFLSSP